MVMEQFSFSDIVLGNVPQCVIMVMSAWERFPLGLGTFPILYWRQCGGMREAAHHMAVLGVTAFRQQPYS